MPEGFFSIQICMKASETLPQKQGLYDPYFEKDSCGVGFVCDIKGRKSHSIIQESLTALKRLAHRGAVGSDPKTGDGAGILIQTPHKYFSKAVIKSGIALPEEGSYGTGLVFFPVDETERKFCKDIFSRIVSQEGQALLGWRKVPVNNSGIGEGARKTEPVIEQPFIEKKEIKDNLAFERKLYIIRKQIENTVRKSSLKQKSFFYITNLSSRTFLYKGLLMPYQVESFFPDLSDPDMESSISLIHSRYSTNTFPTWDLSQPFRFLAHNGEINTLKGNFNWMKARESLLESPLFGKDIEKIKPVLIPGLSDSATIDNAFELLVLGGKPLAQAMMMLIPAAWEKDSSLSKKLTDFYKYHACFSEPWDGPASIAFTDGKRVGAVLDRNGLRPSRYIVTKDDMVVMASEAGVLDIPPENVLISGRLEPGKMFYVDTELQRIVSDEEIKEAVSTAKPYGVWIKENLVELKSLPEKEEKGNLIGGDLFSVLKAFNYTREDFKYIIQPMCENAVEPTGSMGNDTPLSVLSKRPQIFYTYFKQLFAQVTNPAIDSIREDCVMSLETYLGAQKNILGETPSHCRKLRVEDPVLRPEELETIRKVDFKGFRAKEISILFNVNKQGALLSCLDRVCKESEQAIKEGYSFIILSDRGINKEYAALPSLLAVGGAHQHLVKNQLRTQIGIIADSADVREVHHFALLFGYGADLVCPYTVYSGIKYLTSEKMIDLDFKTAEKNYLKAVNKGILKIISKMGISTLHSYRGAQIFEALGIGEEVIERCFSGTPSRIGGIGFNEIEEEVRLLHSRAFSGRDGIGFPYLSAGGVYQWKKDGEFHLWRPESISALQTAVRKGDYKKYKEFAELINDQSIQPVTLRSLLKFKKVKPVPLDEVEPAESLLKRFATGAMSFGSISKGAHETLAIAMNRLGGRSNTGEGGEDPARFLPLPNGDSKRSSIKQVASGRFGVSAEYLANADEIQIKIAQGAKPGEGGQLPGRKVSVTIAKTRFTTPGVTLISPPPHHDIYSIEDLAQLIFDLKNTNPSVRISVKLVSEVGVGTIAAGVAKGHADMILISGGDGGTGASPKSSIRHAGLPWELGLSETHQTLILNDLRSRVRLQTDGQMRTGRDAAVAAILGAEEFGFCTSALITLGCVMLRNCSLNNCSVGIATQDDILQERFKGRVEYVENYFRFVVRELREIMAGLGVRRLNDMIGRTDLLDVNREIFPWKAKNVDFSRILYKPNVPESVGRYCLKKQDHGIDKVLDRKLIEISKPALTERKKVKLEITIRNTDRTTGAMLSGEVCKRFGGKGLDEDTIHIKFRGIAGQSFSAWLAKGLTFELEGLANDYIGKGMSGGKLIVYPDRESSYIPEENIIIGNTSFYGAISGEAYIRGIAGERFCIRNSGLYAVVEGVGDHGCEYMTGGRVVILGRTGRNFAAGMSGGIAYIYDKEGRFRDKCNLAMVELEKVNDEDKDVILRLLQGHYRYTQSTKAKELIDKGNKMFDKFIKVMPLEYKRVLAGMKEEENGSVEPSDG